MFNSKIEAYLFAIHVLNNLKEKCKKPQAIENAINKIRMAIENHEQDPKVVGDILIELARSSIFTTNLNRQLHDTGYHIENQSVQSLEDKYANPLGRRFESQIQIEMLLNPTPAMMAVVGEISIHVISAIAFLKYQDRDDPDGCILLRARASGIKNFTQSSRAISDWLWCFF